MILLTRDAFREAVFARDRHRCVVCGEDACDAHHLIERRLWPDGGYYLSNGVSVCEVHHWLAETTTLSVEELRSAACITAIAVPPGFYPDTPITKWGDEILPDGTRIPGPLFSDASVQKILRDGDVLGLYRHWRKHPRTPHLPWSEGVNDDDEKLADVQNFEGQQVVVTVKMDGQNISLYNDGLHARSLSSASHPAQSRVKALQAKISADIPDCWRICGENLFAKHSIHYRYLPDFFLVHSIWDHHNRCLGWPDTLLWTELLGLRAVPTLWSGVWDPSTVKSLFLPECQGDEMEGYVVRLAGAFDYADYGVSVAKFVRKGHNVSGHGWRHRAIVQNEVLSLRVDAPATDDSPRLAP